MFLIKNAFVVLQFNTLYIMLQQITFYTCIEQDLIDSGCFSEPTCSYKQKLDCSYRNITFLKICENSRTLKVLDYSNNAISFIKENTFENLTNLQRLYLNDNEISRIEEYTFNSLKRIMYLHLSNNKIEDIHRNSFRYLSNLLFIDLEDNQLTTIYGDTFINCNYLWQVHLAKNKIKEIHKDSFRENFSLKHLYCSHNEIQNLEFLKNLPILFFLDLSYNKIQEIPTFTFLNTKDLKKLNLSHNKLEVLYSGTFSHLPVLTDLNLSYNKLKDLGEGPFDYLFTLNSLDIRNNYVQSFSYNANFGQLKNNSALSIYIDDNNWHCNYLHRIRQLPGVKLIYFNINVSVSNIEGIPCKDKVVLLFEESTTQSFSTTQNISTATTTVNTESTTGSTIFLGITNVTTKVISTKGTTSSTSKLTTQWSVTETLEDRPTAVTSLDIQIDKSIVIIATTVGVIIILAALIFSIRFFNKRCSDTNECEYVNDEYLLQTFPPKKSNFYIKCEVYNEYEEVQLPDSDSANDHIYEKIE